MGDAYVCSSDTSAGGLTDTGGDNSLLLPFGGTGIINGSVVFGAGADLIDMNSGAIAGTVDQGSGADRFVITAGSVAGNIQQGSGIDDYTMSGGQVQSLNQGDNLDTFFMSDGRIVDFFDDGDIAVFTGGRIGRVNMKLDDNVFDMSGGIIDRNLVTGFGNDTIMLSGGTIGGNISVSGGTDSVTVTGGSVGGDVRMSFGTDTFVWDNGGIIYGVVDLGGDNDVASLSNLTDANIGSTTQVTGGLGVDSLTFENVDTSAVERFDSWETIDLTNDTELTFDGNLVLGDSGTGTGAVRVDETSTIFGGNASGSISPFTAGQLASVLNAGRIDLTNGGGGTSNTFTVAGNYVGNNGLLFLDTVLGDDSSASDRLVISGGTASGSTGIGIFNAGGSGGSTVSDGIMVVEAANGAITDSGAFSLTGRVAAGAYEYLLFKGGVTQGTADNWYLRSAIVAPTPTPADPVPPAPEPAPVPPAASPPEAEPQPEAPEPPVAPPPPLAQPVPPLPPEATPADPDPVDPAPPVEAAAPQPVAPPEPIVAPAPSPPEPIPAPAVKPAPVPAAGVAPPSPEATTVSGDAVPLYRVEVPAYSVVAPAARHLVQSTVGTFHERRGEQALIEGADLLPAGWGRFFGQSAERKWDGTVAPTFDGDLYGFQVGQDLVGWETPGGYVSRLGLFGGYARMHGDVRGQALGWNDLAVGETEIEGTSFGGYWTTVAPSGWYVDGLIMGTWLNGSATSNANLGIDIDGSAITASIEAGYPVAIADNWSIEPQAQLIWQHLSIDDAADRFSTVSFDIDNALTGRVGARLQGTYDTPFATLQPYLKANVWHDFNADQTVRFGADGIVTELDGTALEVGGGIVAKLNQTLSVFATADYTTDLDGEKQNTWEGNVGISVTW